jgi:hypothetical protein
MLHPRQTFQVLKTWKVYFRDVWANVKPGRFFFSVLGQKHDRPAVSHGVKRAP